MERYSSLTRGIIRIRTGVISYDEFAGRSLRLYIMLNIFKMAGSLFLESLAGDAATFAMGIIFWLYLIMHYNHFCVALKKALLLYFVFSILLIWTVLNGMSENSELLSRFFWLFVFGLPLFGLLASALNTSVILKESTNCVYFATVVALLTIIQASGNGIKGDYSMALGYALLYPILLLIWQIKEKKNALDLIMFVILAFVIISYGSRGQILCIGSFFVLGILFNGDKITAKKIVIIMISAGAAVLLFLNVEALLTFAIQLLGNRGIQSRSLGYFLERAHYTGREVVWSAAIDRIKEKPLLGWGLGIDISESGFYPHNLFLELLLHYGCIIGGVLSVYLIIQAVSNVLINKEHDILTLIFFCYGFIPLMLTSEYLVWPSFWAFFGLCVGRKNRIKGVPII